MEDARKGIAQLPNVNIRKWSCFTSVILASATSISSARWRTICKEKMMITTVLVCAQDSWLNVDCIYCVSTMFLKYFHQLREIRWFPACQFSVILYDWNSGLTGHTTNVRTDRQTRGIRDFEGYTFESDLSVRVQYTSTCTVLVQYSTSTDRAYVQTHSSGDECVHSQWFQNAFSRTSRFYVIGNNMVKRAKYTVPVRLVGSA